MLSKIQHLYPSSIIVDLQSAILFSDSYVWFKGNTENKWLGIPVADINSKEISILRSFLPIYEPLPMNNKGSQSWYQFLLQKGDIPLASSKHRYRILQIHFSGKEINRDDIESTLNGFFAEEMILIWESENRIYIVDEEPKNALDEEGLISISQTLETDLFINAFIYIGKYSYINKEFAKVFLKERSFFNYTLQLSPRERVFSFEKMFPKILTSHMLEKLDNELFTYFVDIFKDDPDLFITIKIFLENNMNASVTAKKLYIHRNTLQYRMDKFTDKTGVNLKDFNSAVTVYFACLATELIH